MEKDTLALFNESLQRFIQDSYFELLSFGVGEEDIRCAFPLHLQRFLYPHTTVVDESINLKRLFGIRLHSTWENSITVYCTDYIRSVHNNIPVFKLSLSEQSEKYNLYESIIIDFSKIFCYKL